MRVLQARSDRFQWQEGGLLRKIASHYQAKIAITWILLLGECLANLMFPLAIGFSVDSLLENSNTGIWTLGSLCLVMLLLAAGRRFYDTRVYSSMYHDLATSLVERKRKNGASTTKLTAQVNLLREIVEFFENSLPELIGALVTFIGVMIVLSTIDHWVTAGCLIGSLLVFAIYAFSEKRIFHYNKQQNDELEKQVDVLKENRRRQVHTHFGRIVKWNIKLSDLETLNFSGVWIVMALLLVFSVVFIVGNESVSYGQKITSIMYVFDYIQVVMSFPLFYQEAIRLKEITGRLSETDDHSVCQNSSPS